MNELECLHTSLGRRFYRMRRKEMAGENGGNKNGARKVAGKRAGGTMAGKKCGSNGGGKRRREERAGMRGREERAGKK